MGRRKDAAFSEVLLPESKHQSECRESDRGCGLTLEVSSTIMGAVMSATRWIVPFNTEPLALFLSDWADVADGAWLLLQAQALADVVCVISHDN